MTINRGEWIYYMRESIRRLLFVSKREKKYAHNGRAESIGGADLGPIWKNDPRPGREGA